MPDISLVPLPGSERSMLPGASVVGPVDQAERIEVTVITRRRAPLPEQEGTPVRISREELWQYYGSDPHDQRLVGHVLSAFGMEVTSQVPGRRQMTLSGPAGAFRLAFGADLTMVASPRPWGPGTVVHRYRTGGLLIPARLAGIVEAVLGLDDRPQARPHALRADRSGAAVSYSPAQVARIYGFPAGIDGVGERMAIIELGGGFSHDDLDLYFSGLNLATPWVTAVGIDGADNVPGHGGSAAIVADMEIAGAVAPGVRQAVYFAPNTDRGFADALISAIHDVSTPTAVSVGWGQREDAWTGQAMAVLDQVLADAAVLGATVCVAAGNDGSSGGAADGHSHVDFPASSPHALACGGTSLRADPAGMIISETVWNGGPGRATGGGVSDVFAPPSWQADFGVPPRLSGRGGRGLPDVAANTDPATGYEVLIDGQAVVVGGTSAVASLWAALACRMAQAAGQPLGMVHPRWYKRASALGTDYGFRSITSGNNGAYSAGPGWDACTGLGSPQGIALLNELIYAGKAPTTGLYEDKGPAQGVEEDLTPEFDEFPEAHPVPPESLPVPSERPEPRWILAQAFEAAYPTRAVGRAFKARTEHLVAVQIGPEREDMLTATGGPPIDQVLPPEPGQHDLVIVFIPPGGEVQSRAVVLPSAGPSQLRTFQFATGPGGQHIELQVVVLHRGRVLQSAILRGLVLADPSTAGPESAIEFTLAVVRPSLSDLESREQFDTAVVVAHTPEGKPTAVGIHEEKVSRFDSRRIGRAAEKFTTILTDLADNPDDYEPPLDREPNVALLRKLALQGVQLYDAFGQYVVEELAGENLNAIQVVVSDPNDFIPVELMYDLPAPTLEAGLCANWRQALRDGHCSPEHHPADPADEELSMVVCPLGFWALSKVIERQVTGRGQPMIDLRSMDFAIRSEPTAGRMHLGRLTAALFAASQRVDRVKPGLSDQVLSTLTGLTGNRASRVYTWAGWVQEVKGMNPPLLVLLSHTEKVQSSLALEIGSREFRVLSQITSSLVKASPDAAPVVLLLGCDTAVADREYQSFAARFREKGAALVVGTIAAVLGEHAAPVSQAIATALHDAAAGDEVTFGVIMRDIRRKLLAEGELMSLCLATFGDADWRLRVG